MRARVAIVTSGRNPLAAGLENAESQLLSAVVGTHAGGLEVAVRVVGGRSARSYATRLGARWIAARPGTAPRRAWRRVEAIHLAGLGLPPPPPGIPYAATFHDLAALAYPDEGELPSWAAEIAERAALVVCPSHFTAGELQRLLGVAEDLIRVVPNGPGHDLSPVLDPLGPEERAALGVPDRFVLRLGGYTRRKNVGRLLDAWQRVSREAGAKLVLCGPPQSARAAILAGAASLDDVVVLDYVAPNVLPRLIRSADVVVSSSLYEGFGMTPLEAMAAGVPAVAVRTPAAEEVCGDAALLVADDSALLASALERALGDDALRADLVARGPERAKRFTWPAAAAELVSVYRELAGGALHAPGR